MNKPTNHLSSFITEIILEEFNLLVEQAKLPLICLWLENVS